MVKIYGLHDTPNRPSSLHTNRLSTPVHSSKNLLYSTGIRILTIGSKFIQVFEKNFFRNPKNVTYLKTSTRERLFLNQDLRGKHLHPTFHLNFCLITSIAINSLLVVCICLSSDTERHRTNARLITWQKKA